MWFGVLAELYDSGTSTIQAIQAISQTLRREQEAELETHLRVLPLKVNVVLMIFFLPPTFLWLFGPLVMEILAQFE
jgi:pilus assembly protein TadC